MRNSFFFYIPFNVIMKNKFGTEIKEMIGTILNTCTILLGSIVGSVIHEGLKEKYQTVLFDAMGFAAFGIGINAICQNMPKSNYPVLFIVSLAVGGLIGTALNLQGRVDRLSVGYSLKEKENSPVQGVITGVLIFCIGTLSIVGPINAALTGDYTYLITNATLDFVTSVVLASTYGLIIMSAAPILFCWQGAIYLVAYLAGDVISTDMITEMSIVGGFLIASTGMSILKIKDLKTLNYIPALFVPIVVVAILAMLQ